MPIPAVIVDDNVEFREMVSRFIKTNFPEIIVVDSIGSVELARARILTLRPEIVILDVTLLDGTAFDLLNAIPKTFYLLFATASDQYAREAFKYSGVDYLVKPFTGNQLSTALRRACENVLRSLPGNYREASKNGLKKLWIPEADGFSAIDISRVVKLNSIGKHTTILSTDDRRHYTIQQSLVEYESKLDDKVFCRVGAGCVINVDHVVRYSDLPKPIIELTDGASIEVQAKTIQRLMEYFLRF
jgi:two-component system, LytTR family, response regulator